MTHVAVAVVAVLITMLLMSRCTSPTVVIDEVVKVDTVYTVHTEVVTDTITVVKWKTKYDTVYREIPVPVFDSTGFTRERKYSYNEFYEDSTYQVAGNILYAGNILKHNQMLVKMKDNITFIPTTTTVYNNRDIVTTKTVTRQPRLLIGAYSYFDGAVPQSGGVNFTMVDNKFRQYTIGKDVLNTTKWMVEYRHPLFYSKVKSK